MPFENSTSQHQFLATSSESRAVLSQQNTLVGVSGTRNCEKDADTALSDRFVNKNDALRYVRYYKLA